MKIYIIGIGLIGGSFAIDVRDAIPSSIIYGIDTNAQHLEVAKSLGVIDSPATIEDLHQADVVLLAIPVDSAIIMLPKVLEHINDDTLVIDAGSTKHKICKTVEAHSRRRNYLAAHPIAGTEFSGPKAAIKGLYQGKTNIICEIEKTAFRLQERALDIFAKLGMRNSIYGSRIS